MTNKTIHDVPRKLLAEIYNHHSTTIEHCNELRALLAAPDPIVEADGVGEPVAWEVSNAGVVGLTRRASGANSYRDAGWVASPLYSAEQLAALQSTISDLTDENARNASDLAQANLMLDDAEKEVDRIKAENERLREDADQNVEWEETFGPDYKGETTEPDKYDDVLLPFVALMRAELHANTHKGDRPGWLQMDRKTAILEVFYHLGKLHQAVHRGEEAAIKEYAADVANMCMMLLDVCACLDEVRRMNP